MPRIYVGIGSNIRRAENIRSGIAALEDAFGALQISTIYEAPAVGFDGAAFYNLVVGFDTALTPDEVVAVLRGIEDAHQRERGGERFASRTLDIDLLLYGDEIIEQANLRIPRADVSRYDFVLRPLAELAPEGRHPVTGTSYAQMWREFAGDRAALTPVHDVL